MKFEDYVWHHQIPEWQDYYINYHVLNELLEVATALYENMLLLNNFERNFDQSCDLMQHVNKIDELFFKTMHDQILLFDDFIHYKFDITIKRRFVLTIYNLKEFAVKPMTAEDRLHAKKKLKTFMLQFYKGLHLVKGFMELNIIIFHKLTSSYKRAMMLFAIYNHQKGVKLNDMFKKTRVRKVGRQLDLSIKLIENSILVNFYRANKYQEGYTALSKMAANSIFTLREASLLGFCIGLCLMCIFVVVLLMIETDFFSETQSDFITYQFPIFRGTLLLFIYITMIGLDVYIWERWNIDFKKVYNLPILSTNAYSIFVTGFSFLAIWMLVFIYCGLSNSERLDFEGKFFNIKVALYFPPFLWVVFFVYLFFPSKRRFSGKSRLFLWSLFKRMLNAPFRRFTVLDYVFLDQTTSLVTTFKDFAYTWCYFANLITSGGNMKNTCNNYPFKTAFIVVTVLPLFWKVFFISNKIYFALSGRKTNKMFAKDMKMIGINAFRILISLANSFFSFFSSDSRGLFIAWLVLSILNTIVMYLADLFIEWGFFNDGGFKLRRLTALRQRWIYYLIIVLNLFMRYSWTITISPNFFPSIVVRIIVFTFVSIVEMARRMIWNVCKTEFEHIKYIGAFNWISEEIVPFPAELNMADPETNTLVNFQFEQNLNQTFCNKDIEKNQTGLSSLDVQLIKFVNRKPEDLHRKCTFVSKITNQQYYFIDEKDERTGLLAYNKSLGDCIQLIQQIKPKLRKINSKERFILSTKSLEPCYVDKGLDERHIFIDGQNESGLNTSVFDPREQAIMLPSSPEKSLDM
jgi:hypothetical protein